MQLFCIISKPEFYVHCIQIPSNNSNSIEHDKHFTSLLINSHSKQLKSEHETQEF